MGHAVADSQRHTATRRHLKKKLQSASYRQETIGWDTDEASDEPSETEAGLAI